MAFICLLASASSAGAQGVALGSAESFGVLAGSAVTSTGATAVIGDVGVSIGGTVAGFPPGTVDAASEIHEGDAVAVQARMDAAFAYRTLGALTCPAANNLTGQNLGGMALRPGVYCFDGNAQLTGALTLTGAGPWTLQVDGLLTIDPSAQVLAPGITTACKGSSVDWQVGGATALVGAGASVIGNIVARNDVSLGAAARLDGRAVALDGSVTLAGNQVSACSAGGRFPPHTAIKVTGGGQVWVPEPDSEEDRRTGRGRATFGFVAMPDASATGARGRFLYLNHSNRFGRPAFARMHVGGSVTHIDVVAVEDDGTPKTVRFDGVCDRRPDCTFSVIVEDHGEGRRDGDDDDDDDDDGEVDDDRGGRRGPGTGPPHRPHDRFGVVIVSNGRIVEARSLRPIARGNIQFHERVGPALTTAVNDVEFGPGASLAVSVALAPGAITTPADAYVVLELPNGQLMSWTGSGLVPGLVPIARGIVPFAFEGSIAQLVVPRGAPPGRYTWLSALTAAGTLNLLTPIAETVFTITP